MTYLLASLSPCYIRTQHILSTHSCKYHIFPHIYWNNWFLEEQATVQIWPNCQIKPVIQRKYGHISESYPKWKFESARFETYLPGWVSQSHTGGRNNDYTTPLEVFYITICRRLIANLVKMYKVTEGRHNILLLKDFLWDDSWYFWLDEASLFVNDIFCLKIYTF